MLTVSPKESLIILISWQVKLQPTNQPALGFVVPVCDKSSKTMSGRFCNQFNTSYVTSSYTSYADIEIKAENHYSL